MGLFGGKGGLGALAGGGAGFLIGGPMGAAVGSSIGGTIGGGMDSADAQAEANALLQQNRDMMAAIELPDLQYTDYKPEYFDPTMAEYKTTSEDPVLRSAQMAALAKMAGLAEDGLSAEDELGFAKARDVGNQMAHAGTQAALQNAEARGVGGSGMEFAMREMANQGGSERARLNAMEQAAATARNRALNNQAYLQATGNVRAQDFANNRANTDVINQFNMANTQAKNQYGAANVAEKNKAQVMNNQGKNDVKQQNFNNKVTKAGGVAQANSGMVNSIAAGAAANQSATNNLVNAGATLGAAYLKNQPQQPQQQQGLAFTGDVNDKYGSIG